MLLVSVFAIESIVVPIRYPLIARSMPSIHKKGRIGVDSFEVGNSTVGTDNHCYCAGSKMYVAFCTRSRSPVFTPNYDAALYPLSSYGVKASRDCIRNCVQGTGK